MRIKNDDDSSLSHTVWNCQYHIVFVPKYRRKAIYGKIRSDIGKYLRRLCDYKGVEIIEANAILDRLVHHSHIFNITGNSYRIKDKLDSLQDENAT